MAHSRRNFLGALGAAAGGLALAPLIKTGRALGGSSFLTRKVVIVGIGGGLRNREALGMAEGATMPNLFGRVPVIAGFGDTDAGDPLIAPEYQARDLILPAPRATPLMEDGALITNLRYAEGAPGHLQGHGCLLSGFYNNIENRADARLPVPTIFELHRRATNTEASDAWYISNVGGFYSALQTSDHPDFGPRFGGRFLSPPNAMSIFLPFIAKGSRSFDFARDPLPAIPDDAGERAAVGRLLSVLDGNSPGFTDSAAFRATAEENAELERHLGRIFSDPFAEIYPGAQVGIGLDNGSGDVDSTADALTVYHAEQILAEFQPSIMALSLIDVDVCHGDFNGYLRNQQVADALVSHLWDFIESTEGLAGQTTMIVLPEHGRHLFFNGINPDSLGRSGIDHGQGDDGDRDVWMLALGPDTPATGVIEPTGVSQSGRAGDTYETIDAIMTAMALLGHDEAMSAALQDSGARPGLTIGEVLS